MTNLAKPLPKQSILEKLEAHQSGLASAVLNESETIAENRRAQESSLRGRFQKARKSLTSAFDTGMMIYPGPYGMGKTHPQIVEAYNLAIKEQAEQASYRDLARTGDNLRLGILSVMDQHGLTADSLGLTAEERESLVLLLPDSQPKADVKPAGTGLVRKFFPNI